MFAQIVSNQIIFQLIKINYVKINHLKSKSKLKRNLQYTKYFTTTSLCLINLTTIYSTTIFSIRKIKRFRATTRSKIEIKNIAQKDSKIQKNYRTKHFAFRHNKTNFVFIE